MPRLRHITLSGRRLFWIVLRQSRNSMAHDRTCDRIHASHTHRPPTIRKLTKKGHFLRAADLIGQLGDPHYLRKPMRFTTNLKDWF